MQQPVNAGFELSPQQKRLWVQGDSPAFRAQIAVLLEGPLEAARLEEAARKVAGRHEILRTTFRRQAGLKLPFQVVGETVSLGWNQLDFSSLPAADHGARIEELFREEAGRRFEVEQGPLLRMSLVRLAADRHVLLISLSSLCGDAVTLKTLVWEVSCFYGGSGAAVEEPLQYADFSQWQNDLATEEHADDEPGTTFWKSLDLASPPPLLLPFEARKNPETGFAPETVPVEIQADVLAQAMAAPDPAFFLACWQILLWRLSGQNDVLVASVCDGRNHEEATGALGLFAKALPVRCSMEADRAFSDVLAQVRRAAADAREWQDFYPASENEEDLPAGFQFEERLRRTTSGGVTFSLLQQANCATRFHLQLRCAFTDGRATAEFHYDPNWLRAETVERVAACFQTLVSSAAQNPRAAIGQLEILPEPERKQILAGFNQTAADFPREQCFHDLFEEQAARHPERDALRFGEQAYTYAELNARANQLAHFLRARGVKEDTVVGLCLERSAEMIIGLLAILKAGGAYVPLIPDNPKSRLAHQLAETRSPLLLTQERFLGQLPAFGGETLCLDRDAPRWSSAEKSNPDHRNTPQNLVYVIYTSGSTGVPKGVAVRHANLVNYTHFMSRRLHLDEHAASGLNFATVSTLAADLGNTCIFPSLASGGCLHVIGYDVSLDGNRFADYASKHPIDVLKITPSHLGALMAGGRAAQILPRKYLVLGGEATTWELLRKIGGMGTCAVLNHYGPTEATVGCCTFSVRENDVTAWAPATLPIGKPISNAQIYIVEPSLRPAPVGVAGELCIGGAGLAAGYLNQPGQTAERFIRNPFSADPEARIYRTGDLARYLPDGNIEFLGRLDHQVKIRGFRVEPAEIEAVLKSHAQVHQALVIPVEDKSGDKRLVAYVVPSGGKAAIPAEDLRDLTQQRLPDYMVPSAFVLLDALPLTPNGKVDRRALPSPDQAQGEAAGDFESPCNAIEEGVAAVWTEVLSRPRIGRHDNFFDLGGHSLLATQVISRLCSRFQVQLPLRTLFETPTVAGMAGIIAQSQPEQTEEVASLLNELEQLSDEEAEQLLAAEMEKSGKGEPQG